MIKLNISVLSFVFGLTCFTGGVMAAELKMNTVEFCPKTPYELWYPFGKRGMFLDGKLNITKETLTFDTHGEFKYVVHKTSDGFMYLELDHASVMNGGMDQFIYLRYDNFSLTYANQSCMLIVHDCTTREGVEYVIRDENKLPNFGGDKAYCGSGSFFRDVDRGRMIGLVTPDIHKK